MPRKVHDRLFAIKGEQSAAKWILERIEEKESMSRLATTHRESETQPSKEVISEEVNPNGKIQ